MFETGVVYRRIERADGAATAALADFGVSTVHEAQGRVGLMAAHLRPLLPLRRCVAGPAVTVLLQPGDNWMLHVVAEQIQPGDVVVAAPTSPCSNGYFGDLLATSFQARGARALVIDAGVRDAAALRDMGFAVWSAGVSAQGTVKATLGAVNVPLVCAGALVCPGDAVVADEDGVVVVPAAQVLAVRQAAERRAALEDAKRARLAAGELGLDMYHMRPALQAAGLRWLDGPPPWSAAQRHAAADQALPDKAP